MVEENQTPETEESASEIVEVGETSKWLTENGFDHESLEKDHSGIELIKVEP